MSLQFPETNNLNSLIELGAKGIFPIFHPSWIEEVCEVESNELTNRDQVKAQKITKSLDKHKNWERKKTALLALSDEERSIFVKSFMDKVEKKILNTNPELQ